ncbi:hypothetical protein G9P44_001166 [Scheffersomyces stipitis]|nr:hypothetical protein G9P44_001166 [Scheffersomyces stipitis]
MSLISNRKRPRGFSETFEKASKNKDATDSDPTAKVSHLNFDHSISEASLSSSSITSPPPASSLQYSGNYNNHSNTSNSNSLNIGNLHVGNQANVFASSSSSNSEGTISSTSTSTNGSFGNPFKTRTKNKTRPYNSAYLLVDSNIDDPDQVLIEENEDDVVDEDPEVIDDEDDEDLIILEERDLIPKPRRNNSDSLLILDSDAVEAYNMFNVNNINNNINQPFEIGANNNPIKKQRTNSLPQLPQARCFYTKLPNNYIFQTPKLGNIKTNVIPHQLNLPPCDDENGHYVIKLNETFANRFIIIKLLGQGTFGKVVQCFDKVNREHVAIKIIRNIQKYRDAAKIELRILSTLKKFDNKNVNHCIHLRECFDYRGHICIVTDLLKISLYDFLENNKFISFPGSHIQAISKQLIRSVSFLHDLNLIHTDLKPENILLHDDSHIKKNLYSSTIVSSYMNLSSSSAPKKTPKYSKVLKNPLIQIIDFGSAIFNDEYHSSIVSTRHYRAPEIVLGVGWSFPCDMWSIGCILVELIIGEPLFKTHDNLEHLAMIEKICGYRIDKAMVKLSKEKENECGLEYFTKEYISSEEDSDGDDDVIIDDETTKYNSLTLMFPTNSTPMKFINSVDELSRIDLFVSSRIGLDIDFDYSLSANYEKNKNIINFGNFTFWWFFIDLLRKLFVINPEDRLNAMDALYHPWFNLGIEDEGTL